jgi:hypothetical protein
LSGSEGQLEENLESEKGLDRQVAVELLFVAESIALSLSRHADLLMDPDGDPAPLDESGVILFPVAGAGLRFCFFTDDWTASIVPATT